jgi:CDP-6-deoxy-D-xylo-4-hexulose-3-dehydrase
MPEPGWTNRFTRGQGSPWRTRRTDGPPKRRHIRSVIRCLRTSRLYGDAVYHLPYIPCSGKMLDAADLRNMVDASLDMWLTAGRFCEDFERKLANRFGTAHAVMTVSGSAANLLAFSALTSWKLRDRRIEPGSEVVTVAASFPTTVAPIVQNRCIPVFVDVDLETFNVDVDQLTEAITSKTRAIMIAHTLGNPFDVEAVAALAKKRGLYLIEDCCDAFGATFKGRGVGTWGDLATLSFYPAHHITVGEGGAVMMQRRSTKVLVESFRDWGRDCWCAPGKANTCEKRFEWRSGKLPYGYDHKFIFSHLGYNVKSTDFLGAIGITQLDKLDTFIERRRENFKWFSENFVEEGFDAHFILPKATAGSDPSWFGFLLTIRDESPLKRRDVVSYLEAHQVGTRLLFAGNLTRQPAFKGVEHRIVGSLKNTDKLMNDSFWIGVWPGIGPRQREYIMETFRAMLRDLLPRSG